MMKLIIRYLVVVLAVLIAAHVVPGISVANLNTALFAGLVLSALNLVVRPILFILTLPATILTLGFFILIINTMLFWGASFLVSGFEVSGFVPAFLGALAVSVVSLIAGRIFK